MRRTWPAAVLAVLAAAIVVVLTLIDFGQEAETSLREAEHTRAGTETFGAASPEEVKPPQGSRAAATVPFELGGRVVDSVSSFVLTGAAVSAEGIGAVRTNENGEFFLRYAGLPTDTVELNIVADGYEPLRTHVTVGGLVKRPTMPVLRIAGYIYGRLAPTRQWWTDENRAIDAYFATKARAVGVFPWQFTRVSGYADHEGKFAIAAPAGHRNQPALIVFATATGFGWCFAEVETATVSRETLLVDPESSGMCTILNRGVAPEDLQIVAVPIFEPIWVGQWDATSLGEFAIPADPIMKVRFSITVPAGQEGTLSLPVPGVTRRASYEICVRMDGQWSHRRVEIVAGKNVRIEVPEAANGRFCTIRVVDEHQSPIYGAQFVSLKGEDTRGVPTGDLIGLTGQDGAFNLPLPEARTQELEIMKPGYASVYGRFDWAEPRELRAGESVVNVPLELTLRESKTSEGRIVDGLGAGVPGVVLRVKREGSGPEKRRLVAIDSARKVAVVGNFVELGALGSTVISDVNGQFALAQLDAGSWEVRAILPPPAERWSVPAVKLLFRGGDFIDLEAPEVRFATRVVVRVKGPNAVEAPISAFLGRQDAREFRGSGITVMDRTSGGYAIDGIPPGAWRAELRTSTSVVGSQVFEIERGQREKTVDIAVGIPGNLRVTLDGMRGGRAIVICSAGGYPRGIGVKMIGWGAASIEGGLEVEFVDIPRGDARVIAITEEQTGETAAQVTEETTSVRIALDACGYIELDGLEKHGGREIDVQIKVAPNSWTVLKGPLRNQTAQLKCAAPIGEYEWRVVAWRSGQVFGSEILAGGRVTIVRGATVAVRL